MIAPSGGFSPPGSSGGSGVSVFMLNRTRVAVCGLKRTAPAAVAVGVELAERRDVVEDPEAAAVRGRDEVVVLDDDVAHRARGHVQTERLPAAAVVEGDEDLALGGGEKEPAAARVLADRVGRRRRRAGR